MFRSPASAPLLLLVDDDPYQAEVASYIAYELGCDFESALSGTEALEKVDARRPDVVLLDVRMPDLSGYEVCRRIKTVGATAGTQVIFVTARTEEEDLLQGFEALANDYVTKPFSARELKARVKNALRIKELLDALTARTQILELQQEISAKVEEDGVTTEDFRARLLVPILDRISSVFGADGVTLHVRRAGPRRALRGRLQRLAGRKPSGVRRDARPRGGSAHGARARGSRATPPRTGPSRPLPSSEARSSSAPCASTGADRCHRPANRPSSSTSWRSRRTSAARSTGCTSSTSCGRRPERSGGAVGCYQAPFFWRLTTLRSRRPFFSDESRSTKSLWSRWSTS